MQESPLALAFMAVRADDRWPHLQGRWWWFVEQQDGGSNACVAQILCGSVSMRYPITLGQRARAGMSCIVTCFK